MDRIGGAEDGGATWVGASVSVGVSLLVRKPGIKRDRSSSSTYRTVVVFSSQHQLASVKEESKNEK